MSKVFKHFKDSATVHRLIAEIQNRHSGGYPALLEDIIKQLRSYFHRTFSPEKPSRFNSKTSDLIRPKFLVALSGGIDSSVVTYLAVRAVSRDHVLPITMPARDDDQESLAAAKLVLEDLDFKEPGVPHLINITGIVDAHIQAMRSLTEPQLRLGILRSEQSYEQRIRSGNFASRIRVGILSDLQRAIRGRILGTVNRPEYCQGYNTKFGTPISYDLGVLNELYKTDIYQLAKLLEVPQAIQEAIPSTGYFPGQTHEDELGATLEEQDILSYLLYEKEFYPKSIIETYGVSPEFIKLMKHRFEVSEHKRILNQRQEFIQVAKRPLLK